MHIRWMLILTATCAALLIAGYSLTQGKPEVVGAAVPVVDKVIGRQATTVEEVRARLIQPLRTETVVVVDNLFGYHLAYPAGWLKTELSSDVVLLQSTDGASQVKIEIAGVLPADGLAAFVDRSRGQEMLLTRQSLTIHGFPAERLLLYSDKLSRQVTNFYLTADDMVYVISGSGQQKAIESIARSFNAPQLIALR